MRALDRIAGTEVIAIETIRKPGSRGVQSCSFNKPFLDADTTTPMGEVIVGLMVVLAAS